MYIKKEKNHYFECYKKLVCAGPKSARNILTDLSQNPSRNPPEPGPTRKSRPDLPLWF